MAQITFQSIKRLTKQMPLLLLLLLVLNGIIIIIIP